jgi:hypothetical protein
MPCYHAIHAKNEKKNKSEIRNKNEERAQVGGATFSEPGLTKKRKRMKRMKRNRIKAVTKLSAGLHNCDPEL